MFDPRFVNRHRRYGIAHDKEVVHLGVKQTHFKNGVVWEEEYVATYPGCGHSGNHPPGGVCSRCSQPVCTACHKRCQTCGASLCPTHAVKRDAQEHCTSCDYQQQAVGMVRSFVKGVLSFFVEFQ